MSTTARKNPIGLVEAFRLAFEPGSGPVLVLKSINAERCPQDLSALREAAAGHPDIQLSDAYVTQEHMQALTAACDCYVSLHRSEGFGLGLAEAMAYGKPTIATGYSGNRAFMDESNSYLVSYQPAPVPPDAGPYLEGMTWADPDVEDAARLMREVVENPDEAHERAERGRATIERGLLGGAHRGVPPRIAGGDPRRRSASEPNLGRAPSEQPGSSRPGRASGGRRTPASGHSAAGGARASGGRCGPTPAASENSRAPLRTRS